MDPIGFLSRWLDVLAGLVERLRDEFRQRRALFVTEVEGTFVLRAARSQETAEPAPLAVLAAGVRVSEEIEKLTRHRFLVLECPSKRVVTRHLSVPMQAREFLAGLVRNQVDRLSPWPSVKVLYQYYIKNEGTAGQAMLDVQVVIALRTEVESLRARFCGTGLSAERVVVSSEGALPLTLWSGTGAAMPGPRRTRLAIGGGLAAVVAVCAATSLWAFLSAAALQSESDERAQQLRGLQKSVTAPHSPQMLAGLPPPRRAWAAKESSVSVSSLLETLSRAIPDGAYLSDFQFEDRKLRLVGFADDAPPLIAALERSGHVSDVHFFAPTTRGNDGTRFSIEAHVEPRLDMKGTRP